MRIKRKKPLAISMCDKTGNMLKPWARHGYHCICVDTQHSIRHNTVKDNIHYVWGDCRSWVPPYQPFILFAFPPCTHLASSGARDFKKKGWQMLRDGMDLFMACKFAAEWANCPYMIENPVGRISGLHHKYTYSFDPCDYGDPYTKKTCLWVGGGFVMPKKNPVPATLGSIMHTMSFSKDRTDKRNTTPMGFARAVFEANHL